MGLFARIKAVWYALLSKSVTEMEDKHAIALAETKLQQATERLKEARQGLINYQALVLKVQQQVDGESSRITTLTGQIKNHLNAAQEEIAAQLALELARVKNELASNEEQLKQHQENYENNLLKMKAALKDIETSKKDLEKKKAVLQMEKALAEISETAGALNTKFDVSSDIGAILSRVDEQINKARARSKVASDLSDQGVDVLKAKLEADKLHAKELLEQFKIEQGLVEPSSTPTEKTVGPQRQATPESD
ncbi:MAG TPA: PspA/IM30 family protein [Vicinamibacteria bacterium]|nr:PspA/IM30 family protein [Vicinamibacteria bacterium]